MSDWYDVNKTLSHNCLFNFVVGPRGVGKTYSCKERVIRNWLRDGAQFVYLRRFETEIKTKQLDNFFLDLDGYDDHEFRVKGQTFLCDDEVMGYALCLSKAAQYKSVPFPKVTVIIFDEFIIDQGLIRYLDREVETFCEMYSTIARLRDVKVLFLSNAITFTNPYFLYFNIDLRDGQTISKKNDILIELVRNDSYMERASNTRFGKIIQGRKYGDYAINNKFIRDDDKFIEKMPDGLKCRVLLKADGQTFGLYTGRSDKWYISDKYDATCNLVIALQQNEHDDVTVMIDDPQAKLVWGRVKQWYYAGNLRFTSLKAKNVVSSKLVNIWR